MKTRASGKSRIRSTQAGDYHHPPRVMGYYPNNTLIGESLLAWWHSHTAIPRIPSSDHGRCSKHATKGLQERMYRMWQVVVSTIFHLRLRSAFKLALLDRFNNSHFFSKKRIPTFFLHVSYIFTPFFPHIFATLFRPKAWCSLELFLAKATDTENSL